MKIFLFNDSYLVFFQISELMLLGISQNNNSSNFLKFTKSNTVTILERENRLSDWNLFYSNLSLRETTQMQLSSLQMIKQPSPLQKTLHFYTKSIYIAIWHQFIKGKKSGKIVNIQYIWSGNSFVNFLIKIISKSLFTMFKKNWNLSWARKTYIWIMKSNSK